MSKRLWDRTHVFQFFEIWFISNIVVPTQNIIKEYFALLQKRLKVFEVKGIQQIY